MKLWKTLKVKNGVLRSDNGSQIWKVGKWYKVDGELSMCHAGFHASKNIIDAMRYVTPGAIAEVEVRGGNMKQDNKQCWREMRVVHAWEWTKEDSVELAVYAAELVIGIFEKWYPDDKRPREAIEAAKVWLKNPCEKTRNAYAAAAAAAHAAASYAAASYASYAAAAHAAYAAAAADAHAAAHAAYAAAAHAAYAHASYAAYAAVLAKCHRFVARRLRAKKETL